MNIECVLGRITSKTEGVVIDKESLRLATGNSNRWMFDVVAPCKNWEGELTLLDFRSGKPKPPGSLAPDVIRMNAAAAQALIFFPDPDLIKMAIVVPEQLIAADQELRFRVSLQAIHSLTS